MERWSDQGIILSARAHGDHNAVVSALTLTHGRFAGYVAGGMSSRRRADLEPGNLAAMEWSARTAEHMGSMRIEPERAGAAALFHDPFRLLALQSACALMDMTLAEREPHPALFRGTLALIEALAGDVWAESYVMWELALLGELGFSLDLRRCAGGGDASDLVYVSPRTGVAVSRERAAPYRDKLLALPQFLLGLPDGDPVGAVHDGLRLGAYFLEHRVLSHTSHGGLPAPRSRLENHFRDLVTGRAKMPADTGFSG